MIDRRMQRRFGVSALLYLLMATGLGFRLAFLHLGPHEDERQRLDDLRRFREDIEGRRGLITDRSGESNILAIDVPTAHICADPERVLASDAVVPVAEALSGMLDMDVDAVAVKLNRPGRRYSRIKRYVPMEIADLIDAKDLPGVFLREANLRYYPHNTFLCHVLGFVNYEGYGSSGLEQAYHEYLKGKPGVIEGRLNGLRQELYVRRAKYEPGEEGHRLELTIDQNMQHILEAALDEMMETSNATAAWSIVQHVKTGEILAMASRPAYDLNEFYRTSPEERMNRAISVNYEPGSTMKAACFAAALNEGIVTPETVFDCENGSWFYKGRILRDSHGYGLLNVADGLKKSSNILTAKVALMLGNERLYEYFRKFGLGELTGIDLPGEEAGIFHPPSRWYGISPTRIPIGQGIASTALQILGIYCTIANDGYRMRPYVVRRVIDDEGNIVMSRQPEVVTRVIRPETAALMRDLLTRVTDEDGTGRRARVPGIAVAGKTGTAQKPEAGGYSDDRFVASFVGFLPADEPEIGIIVVADEPKPDYYGGVVAAPAFQKMAVGMSRYMGLYARYADTGERINWHQVP